MFDSILQDNKLGLADPLYYYCALLLDLLSISTRCHAIPRRIQYSAGTPNLQLRPLHPGWTSVGRLNFVKKKKKGNTVAFRVILWHSGRWLVTRRLIESRYHQSLRILQACAPWGQGAVGSGQMVRWSDGLLVSNNIIIIVVCSGSININPR